MATNNVGTVRKLSTSAVKAVTRRLFSKTSGILGLSPRARRQRSCVFLKQGKNNSEMSDDLLEKIAEIDSEVAENLKGKDNFLFYGRNVCNNH
jgi:hypothetical protein